MKRLDRLEQNYRDAKNHIYGLAHNVCVNDKEQAALLSALGDVEMQMLKGGEDGKYIILTLMGIIIDSLQYDGALETARKEILARYPNG
jgi:hypothetical protein